MAAPICERMHESVCVPQLHPGSGRVQKGNTGRVGRCIQGSGDLRANGELLRVPQLGTVAHGVDELRAVQHTQQNLPYMDGWVGRCMHMHVRMHAAHTGERCRTSSRSRKTVCYCLLLSVTVCYCRTSSRSRKGKYSSSTGSDEARISPI